MKALIDLIKEFKPVLWFVGKFFILYVILNLIYGFYIESYGDRPDAVTGWVGRQVSVILNWSDLNTSIEPLDEAPKFALLTNNNVSLNLYEGCNGLNVMILFVVFLFSYSGFHKNLFWFIPLGLLSIHIINLLRILGLYYVAENIPRYLYFTHKFLFTGIIFAWIFVLWIIWVKSYSHSH